MSETKYSIRYRSYEDPLRAWILSIKRIDGSISKVIVIPEGYNIILKDANVISIDILSYGVLSQAVSSPYILEIG